MAAQDLPIRRYTIRTFLELLQTLVRENKTREFVILLLTGQYNGHQAAIEALENRIYNEGDISDRDDPSLYQYCVVHDIDSALGISNDICVRDQHLVFYVIPRFRDALHKDVGLERPIFTNEDMYIVKLHKIPNMLFARWGIRNEILIFFPGLWILDEREGHKVDNSEIALFFQHVTRVALNRLMPGLRGSNLPPDFDAELWRSRNPNGSMEFSGRVLSSDVAEQLGDALREAIEEACEGGIALHWARHFFFLHQIKGVKDSNPHDPIDAGAAFEHFLMSNHLSRDIIEDTEWHFDLGAEVSSRSGKDSTAWMAGCHGALLRDAALVPEQHAVRMTRLGSTSYYKDPTSHFTEIAGCRVTPGVLGRGPLEFVKMQAYQTDKALTASKGEGPGIHAKHVTLKQLLDKSNPSVFLQRLYDVCQSASDAGVVSNARFEIRVPYSTLEDAWAALREINWRKYLVAIPCEDWWLLRTLPLIAYKTVIDIHLSGTASERTNIRAVLLVMATVWLTNSLYATPDTGPSSRDVLRAVLPHRPLAGMQREIMPFKLPQGRPAHDDGVEEDGEREDEEDRATRAELIGPQPSSHRRPYAFHQEDEEDSDESGAPAVRTGPCHPYGMFFLRSIEFDSKNPVPALSPSPLGVLKESAFEYFAGQSFASYVDFVYDGVLFKKINPNRTRNKVKQRPHVPEPDAPIPLVFDLQNGGKMMRKPEWMGGEILRDDGEGGETVTRNEFLSAIYHQLMVDAVNKAPNPHGGDAYVKIEGKHLSRTDVSIFKSNNPGASLLKARMRNGDAKDWELTFKHILPPKGSLKVGKTQNYPGCAYYKMWGHFMEEVRSERAIADAREAFKARLFGEVAWFPWAKALRMWESSSKEYPNAKPSPGLLEGTPAPHIILRKPCVWNEDERWTPDGIEHIGDRHSDEEEEGGGEGGEE